MVEGNPFFTIFKKEVKILYYAFFKWKKPNSRFLLHQNSSYFWLFLALMHEQLIEMVFLHIYMKQEDPALANIVTALHIYSVFYIMGDYNWVRNSPVLVKNNRVHVRIGARRELHFHLKDIAHFRKASIQYNKSGGMIHEKGVFHVTAFPRVLTRIFGMSDELQYEIIFKTPLQSKGYFGQRKEVNKALLYIDQSDELIEFLKNEMEKQVDGDEFVEEGVTKPFKNFKINWRLYFSLILLNLTGAIALAPYAIARGSYHEQMGVSEILFSIIFVGQILLEAAILIIIAMLISKKIEWDLPLISTINRRKDLPSYKNKILATVGYGVGAALLILLTSYIISKPLGIDNSSINEPVWWLGVLGSFGAAATEETIFRLFLVTFLLWMFMKLPKVKRTQANWLAITVAALIFGVLHYGVASSTFEMTMGLFAGMLLINGIGGVVFGALFIFWGFEFAVLAHFMADIVIHVVAPQFI
jgi:membrane protease YdiL (CAAX protease family)